MLVAGNCKTGRNELKIGLVGDEISKKKRTGAIFAILSISTILAMLLTRVPGWCRGPRMRGFGSPKPSFCTQTGTGSALHLFCWARPSPHSSVSFQRKWGNQKNKTLGFLKLVLCISTFLLVANDKVLRQTDGKSGKSGKPLL